MIILYPKKGKNFPICLHIKCIIFCKVTAAARQTINSLNQTDRWNCKKRWMKKKKSRKASTFVLCILLVFAEKGCCCRTKKISRVVGLNCFCFLYYICYSPGKAQVFWDDAKGCLLFNKKTMCRFLWCLSTCFQFLHSATQSNPAEESCFFILGLLYMCLSQKIFKLSR